MAGILFSRRLNTVPGCPWEVRQRLLTQGSRKMCIRDSITARAKEIAEISSNITQHKAVPKPDEVDLQQLSFFDTVKDDDIIRELDSLELSTMTPLDAMNTLYRLQTKLKNRWKETG